MLHASVIWQPEGIDLAWSTSVPFLALLASPITLLGGPVLTYNVLTLLAPVLAALSAYVLCLYLTGHPAAAILGGLLYGFSTYGMSESLAQLNLDFTAALPCVLLVVLARLDDRLSRRQAAGLAALLLAAQFYISLEILATTVLFGGIGWGMALSLLPARRTQLWRLVTDGFLTAGLTVILVLPFLWDILTTPRGTKIPINWSYMFAARTGNMLVTTPRIMFNAPGARFGSASWLGHIPQYDFTTGLPLVILTGWYLAAVWRQPATRLLAYMLFVLVAASLGPQLWIGGYFSGIIMPWHALLRMPLINAALPARFMLYTSLLIALIVALWIAQAHSSKELLLRTGFATIAWAAMLAPPHPVEPAPYADFFQPGRLESVLGSGARVLILPVITGDNSSFWQAENHFGFAQTQGYLGMPPQAALRNIAVRDMIVNQTSPLLGQEILEFCLTTKTQFVVAGPNTAQEMIEQMRTLSWKTRKVDDVLIFDVPEGSNLHG